MLHKELAISGGCINNYTYASTNTINSGQSMLMEVNCNMHNMKYQYKNHLCAQKREEFADDLLTFAKTWFALPESILT